MSGAPFTTMRDGFAACGLRTDALELAVTPEIGGCIVSLRSLRTGREWMWQRPHSKGLFASGSGEAFELGSLTGAVECVPTIAPCTVLGRELPDHGEAWTAAWELDDAAFRAGTLRTSVRLPVSELEFSRSIRLHGPAAHFAYRIRNASARAMPYLWAFHPLFRIEAGDRVELPESASGVRSIVSEWVDSLDAGPSPGNCGKLFLDFSAGGEGCAALCRGGERLRFRFDPAEIPYLGLWFTHGGWHGFTHLAIEPANAMTDSLADAPANPLQPGAERTWKFEIGLEAAGGR